MSEHSAKILAVASGGGHWVQLQRLRPAFAGHQVTFVTVSPCDVTAVAPSPVILIADANARTPFRMLWLLFRMAWIVLSIRPDVVLTTGAAPGYWAIRFGRWCGAKTVFIDSIANAEQLSFSGRLSIGKADVTLTQWPELAAEHGPRYWGSVV